MILNVRHRIHFVHPAMEAGSIYKPDVTERIIPKQKCKKSEGWEKHNRMWKNRYIL